MKERVATEVKNNTHMKLFSENPKLTISMYRYLNKQLYGQNYFLHVLTDWLLVHDPKKWYY